MRRTDVKDVTKGRQGVDINRRIGYNKEIDIYPVDMMDLVKTEPAMGTDIVS